MRLGFRRKTRSCLILTGILFITMIICLKPEPLAVLVSIPYILGQNQSSTGSPELESDSCVQARTKPSFVICTHNMNEDIYVSRSLQTTGIWEPKMTKIFQSILTSNKNTTVIDVGANVGYFTLLAASLGSNIIAIEPIDKNIQKLVHGVLVNNFQDKIVILRNVISRARGVVRLDISSDTNQGAARVIMETEVTSSSKTTKIASIVLDDLVKFIKTQNVVIKVDIEGHECRALEKSMLLFERFNVTYIFTEWSKMTSVRHRYGVACPPEHIRKMCRNLTKRGFIPYDITYNKPLDPKLCDRWRYNDVYWKSNKLV